MKQKILYMLMSAVIAIGLWAYVVTVVSPESEEIYRDIPVVINGESLLNERGFIITGEKAPQVTMLKLYGNRSDLRKLNSRNITIVMDVSRITETGEVELTYSISYPGDIPGGSIQVMEQMPERIQVRVSEKKSAKVPVRVEYVGKVPEQFIVDKLNQEVLYDTVTVEGPAEVIETIDHAKIKVDLEGKTETINRSYQYTLCDAQGEPVNASSVTTNIAEIPLKLVIQMVKEVKLSVKVVPGGGANSNNTVIDLSPLSIQVAGNELLLQDLDVLELGTIQLGECEDGFVKLLDINSLLPTGVTNLTSNVTATATLHFIDLETKVLKITNIRTLGVPVGCTAEVLESDVTIKVRGPKAQIELLTEDHVIVYADFTGVDKGVNQLVATVYLSDGFADVGVMGSYAIHGRLELAPVVNG